MLFASTGLVVLTDCQSVIDVNGINSFRGGVAVTSRGVWVISSSVVRLDKPKYSMKSLE